MAKESSQAYNRTKVLADKVNLFLTGLTGIEKRFLEDFSVERLIEFKLALSDINNILTLKATEAFAKWLAVFFSLEDTEITKLIQVVNSTKPNTNGYDIELTDHTKIIAEIKCIIPINSGNYYGAAQRNAILDDAIKLEKGKKKIPDTSNFIKLIGLIDLGAKTNEAVTKLIQPAANIRTEQQVRLDRHGIVKKLKMIDEQTKAEDLSTDYIFIKKIKID